MPLKKALRNTFFLPNTSSKPGGHAAKIAQTKKASTMKMISDQIGCRLMNDLMARSTALRPAKGRRRMRAVGPPQRSSCILPVQVDFVRNREIKTAAGKYRTFQSHPFPSNRQKRRGYFCFCQVVANAHFLGCAPAKFCPMTQTSLLRPV